MVHRYELTEQARRLRNEEKRDPVEAAFHALAALRGEDRTRAIAKFNTVFERVVTVPRLVEQEKSHAAE